MASLQATLFASPVAARSLVGQARLVGQNQPQCFLMLPLNRRSPSTSRSSLRKILNKSSESSFAGARFSGEPVGLVKVLSAKRRQSAVRASEGRRAARDVEKKSKNIFENIVDFFKYIIRSILNFFSSILGGISRLFGGKERSAKSNLRSAGDKVEGAGRDVGNAAEDAIDALGDKGKDAKRSISDGLDDASSRLKRS